MLDNLSTARAADVLLDRAGPPRWEFVFQPTYAAYLNLIEPCRKILRALAVRGRRFKSSEEITWVVADATNPADTPASLGSRTWQELGGWVTQGRVHTSTSRGTSWRTSSLRQIPSRSLPWH